MKKFFNFNSDMFDMDFFILPTDQPEKDFDPEKVKKEGFKVSYHFDSSMDKPEIKLDGDLSEAKLAEYLKNIDFDKIPHEMRHIHNALPKKEELDASDLYLEPKEEDHEHDLHVLEPYSEINDFDNFVEILLEVPGVDQEEIYVYFSENGEKITFTAHSANRRYFKSLDLPFESSSDHVSIEINNGIAFIKVMKPIY